MTKQTFKKQVKQEDGRSLSDVISTILITCTQKESTLSEIVDGTKISPGALREYLNILLHRGLIRPVEWKLTRRYQATSKGEDFLRQNLALFKAQKELETECAPTEKKSPERCINKTSEETFAEYETEEETLILPRFTIEETWSESITDRIEEIFARYELKEEQPPWADADAGDKVSPLHASLNVLKNAT